METMLIINWLKGVWESVSHEAQQLGERNIATRWIQLGFRSALSPNTRTDSRIKGNRLCILLSQGSKFSPSHSVSCNALNLFCVRESGSKGRALGGAPERPQRALRSADGPRSGPTRRPSPSRCRPCRSSPSSRSPFRRTCSH